MAEKFFLSLMGLILGFATFTAVGLAAFTVMSSVQDRVVRAPVQTATTYAQVQPPVTAR